MIREDEMGFWYLLELKCQVCGIVLDHTEIFGDTAKEAADDAGDIRNQVRCSAHESGKLAEFTPDDLDSMFLSEEEMYEDDDE